ncbi:HD domain-containing protein [Actinomadura luteofluorescens]|uniref:HD domain-containing protein n=1 Tax=Actinomadura luteofluorescens TaxID=46163 RepID=UPI003D909C29
MTKNTAAWARDLARKHLETPLPRRWAHTQGVARQARALADMLGDKADLLEAAAWLHDIGYAPDLVNTGFHPLDGARYLRDIHHAEGLLCQLVAHHSCAQVEARERGLANALTSEFGLEAPPMSDPLIYCDMTTGPDGQYLTVETRIREILSRYETGHVVNIAINKASPDLIQAAREVCESLTSTRG